MAEPTFRSIVGRQIQILQHMSETLMVRALAGVRSELDAFFAVQDRLEHWLQYQSPVPYELTTSVGDAPPPLASLRPSPPLPHEQGAYAEALEALVQEDLRPRVQFPPEPLWSEELERDQGEER
jgi:hypothetical protein